MTTTEETMMTKQTWLEKHGRPCKIGTIPAIVRVNGKSVVEPGRYIEIKECEGDKWHYVLVTQVHPDGYFKADR